MLNTFGHSEANAALFNDFGFEVLFVTRVNSDLKDKLKKDKMMHFLWTPFSSQEQSPSGPKKQILVHVNSYKNTYSYLPGMQYETRELDDNPVITNQGYRDFNIDKKCISLINVAQSMADEQLHTSDVMLLHGGDFGYMNANSNFDALE